jgi:hypothetical protein
MCCIGLAFNLVTTDCLDVVSSIWSLPVIGMAVLSADIFSDSLI